MPTPLPWRVKKWDGTTWQNLDPKKWNASSWVAMNYYFWNGTSWVLMTDRTPPTTDYFLTYFPTWTDSYQGNNTKRTDSNVTSLGRRYQGWANSTWGIQKSMYAFDYASIFAAVDGYVTAYGSDVFYDNLHWYYTTAGGTVFIGTHNYNSGSSPTTFQYNRYAIASGFIGYQQGTSISLPADVIQWFAEGSMAGTVLYIDSTDTHYYGYFQGSNTALHLYFAK